MTELKRHTPSTPRSVLTTSLILLVVALLAGCATSTPPTSTTNRAAPTELVMIIRHGEKPDGSDPGIDARGGKDDSSLTATGWQRAKQLVDLFDPASGTPQRGLATPVVIYAAGANDDGEGTRTRETVTPLADRLGLTVNTDFGKGEEKDLIKHLIAQPGPALISWQHEEIPSMANAFPSVTPSPPSDWPDDRFDVIWVFTKTGDGWRFSQLPELVLPQDDDGVIKD
jgi:broad specificity phosphatase PhoE